MQVLRSFAVAAVAVVAAGGAFSATPSAASVPHTRLVKSLPAKDTTITVAPKALTLHFSEVVKPSIAGVRLLASDSSVVPVGALTTGEGTPPAIVAPITGAMKPGTYRVMWRVAGDDGHPVTGNFVFTLKAAQPQ